jgi:hypothetical protein
MTQEPTQKTYREQVMAAIVLVCEHKDAASRMQIVALTGLKMNSVDEAVRSLKNDDLITMLNPGFYAPVDQTPDRMISTTMLPKGRTKIEVGDQIMDLSAREAFALAKLLAGALLAFRMGA